MEEDEVYPKSWARSISFSSIALTDAALANVVEYHAEPHLAEPEYFSTWVRNHFAKVGSTGTI